MKNEFAFLYPPPRAVRLLGGAVDIRSVSFPLEVFRRYEPLFRHFGRRNRSRGLEVVLHERPELGAEEHTVECGAGGIVLSAASPRGRFFALSTLLQALAFHEHAGRMPAFALRDSPQLAFRGFMLAGAPPADLARRLLRLSLLKFSHLAVPASGSVPELDSLARMTGVEVSRIGTDARAVYVFDPAATASLDAGGTSPGGGGEPDGDWFASFSLLHRRSREKGLRTAVWSDPFLDRPERIRRIPGDVLVLQREGEGETARLHREAEPLFRRHHVFRLLCPWLGGRGRFLPDARAGLARVEAAWTKARGAKPAGVLLLESGSGESAVPPEGAAMLHFQAGCLLWSGRLPGPESFSRWLLGRSDPDLFRIYAFLSQAEHRLPHSHLRYLFEDPLVAPFSRQGDPREVAAHFLKAAQYLKKRELAPCELSAFIGFIQRLYAAVAAKVEFSMLLVGLLSAGDDGQGAVLEAGRLQRLLRELREASREWQAEALDSDFVRLDARLEQIGREAASAPGREELLALLAAGRGLDAADPLPGEDFA